MNKDVPMNKFEVICPGCRTLYEDIVVHGLSMLLHRGLRNENDESTLPTPSCVRLYSYVAFETCGHCCPETFGECPECSLKPPEINHEIGVPTQTGCCL